MVGEYLLHTTVEGERWDHVAYAYYGDTNLIQIIAEANPTIPMVPVLPTGVELMIPIIERLETVTLEVPPWLS